MADDYTLISQNKLLNNNDNKKQNIQIQTCTLSKRDDGCRCAMVVVVLCIICGYWVQCEINY